MNIYVAVNDEEYIIASLHLLQYENEAISISSAFKVTTNNTILWGNDWNIYQKILT